MAKLRMVLLHGLVKDSLFSLAPIPVTVSLLFTVLKLQGVSTDPCSREGSYGTDT
jgi:hypothetical protein